MANNITVAKAEYGVPHVKFARTDDGFEVRYRRLPYAALFIFVALGVVIVFGFFALIFLTNFILALLITAAVGFGAYKIIPVTRIRIDGDYVKVNSKAMSRDDFGTFHIYETGTIKTKDQTHHYTRLGYSFGNRSFPLPGTFKEREATEIAAGLNRHLTSTPRQGVHQVAPDALREVRPADF